MGLNRSECLTKLLPKFDLPSRIKEITKTKFLKNGPEAVQGALRCGPEKVQGDRGTLRYVRRWMLLEVIDLPKMISFKEQDGKST